MRHVALLLVAVLGACADPVQAPPLGAGAASVSGPLALSLDGRTLWVVNPDADSVTAVDVRTLTAGAPVPVGREPWAVAVTPSGAVVVMNRADGSLSLLAGGARHDVAVGPEPGGLALSADGRLAYVTVSSADEVVVVDLGERRVAERIAVGRQPWSIGVMAGEPDVPSTVVVAHRFARSRADAAEATNDGKEAWLTLLTAGAASELAIEPFDFGFVNVVEGLALSGDDVWLAHLLHAPEEPREFDTTVSGGVTRVSFADGVPAVAERIHVNEDDFSTPTNFPRAIALSPDGATAYVVLAGSDAVMGIGLAAPDGPVLLGFWATGSNPRGIVVDASGARAYVMNHLSRDVSVLDLEDVRARREVARVAVVGETLPPVLLRGQVLFNLAADPRISHLGWISCASCHPDGGTDNTTWATPEGLRQTTPLWRLDGTAPFHASATRDEVQDFEVEIEGFMGGSGLAPALAAPMLGAPNGGRSFDLDALAAYVLTGIRVPDAALGDAAQVAAGREVFAAVGCAGCHGGPAWTRSALPGPVGTLAPNGEEEVLAVLRDVGTFAPGAVGLGANGFDVPTLLGLHATAPYLHDGSAGRLGDVLANPRHAPASLSAAERVALAAFLATIDGNTPPFD
jgi:YVTN family beta-propeller protein